MAFRLALTAITLGIAAPAGAQSRDDNLHAFLQLTFADARAEWPEGTYTAVFADLNGDGRSEALVMPHAGLFCGSGGCALYIYTPQGSSWRQVEELTITGAPVRMLPTRTRGWRDLAVQVRSGGMDLPRQVRLRFNGSGYSEARLRGAAGRVLIAESAPSRPLFR